MGDDFDRMASEMARAMIADPGACYRGWWHQQSLFVCARMLAKLVRDAKPIIEFDADMAELGVPNSRDKVAPDVEARDWMAEFERLTAKG